MVLSIIHPTGSVITFLKDNGARLQVVLPIKIKEAENKRLDALKRKEVISIL